MTALWWQSGVIYQIYPRSFQDANGDGIGDLKGIERRLGYLASLGVDAIWISPLYPSPMADFGYDVSDCCDIDPRFGTLEDFGDLLAQAHARGLKVLLDFVPNHTSDRHPWFVASRSSRDNPKRDWYIWRDPAPNGGPPNNWISDFGGSAWEWDEATGQYYYPPGGAATRLSCTRSLDQGDGSHRPPEDAEGQCTAAIHPQQRRRRRFLRRAIRTVDRKVTKKVNSDGLARSTLYARGDAIICALYSVRARLGGCSTGMGPRPDGDTSSRGIAYRRGC